jgi:hypothetical protein
MPSQPAPWTIYREYACPLRSRFLVGLMQHRALDPFRFGDALWSIFFHSSPPQAQSDIDSREPGPIYSYRRVRLGDVGYIRRGRFHLLFSAGIPLGSRVPGTDVPLTFEPLDVGPIIRAGSVPQAIYARRRFGRSGWTLAVQRQLLCTCGNISVCPETILTKRIY